MFVGLRATHNLIEHGLEVRWSSFLWLLLSNLIDIESLHEIIESSVFEHLINIDVLEASGRLELHEQVLGLVLNITIILNILVFVLNSNELFPVLLALECCLLHFINSPWLLLSLGFWFLVLLLWGNSNLAVILEVLGEIQEHHSTL